MANCRTCKLYDLDAVRNARGSIMSNRVARCLWKSTETWPASVSDHLNRRPTPGHMAPDDGERCQRYIKRDTQP